MDGPNNPTHRHALDSNNCQQRLCFLRPGPDTKQTQLIWRVATSITCAYVFIHNFTLLNSMKHEIAQEITIACFK